MEPLLDIESDSRLILFPIVHADIWAIYKTMLACHWAVEEADLSTDVSDWTSKMTSDERHFVSHILAFFASSDAIVMENLSTNFAKEVAYPEARMAYAAQSFFETVHAESYGILIDTIISSTEEKQKLFQAIRTMPAVSKKARWAEKWISSDQSFATRLFAFAVVEAVMFSASFCSIFWLKTRGLMPGLAFLNSLISRDEGLHVNFAALLYSKHLNTRLSDERAHEIIREAVDIEIEFVTKALDVRVIGMNATLMVEYVRYVADHLLGIMGHPIVYNATMPFEFMNNISVGNKSNFFEARVSEYSKAQCPREFETTEDF